MSGKGSKQRPRQVGRDTYSANWDAVFVAGRKAHPHLRIYGVGERYESRLTGTIYDGTRQESPGSSG